jgi:hypothetical protein
MARSGREYCFLILETEIFEKMIDELKLISQNQERNRQRYYLIMIFL